MSGTLVESRPCWQGRTDDLKRYAFTSEQLIVYMTYLFIEILLPFENNSLFN